MSITTRGWGAGSITTEGFGHSISVSAIVFVVQPWTPGARNSAIEIILGVRHAARCKMALSSLTTSLVAVDSKLNELQGLFAGYVHRLRTLDGDLVIISSARQEVLGKLSTEALTEDLASTDAALAIEDDDLNRLLVRLRDLEYHVRIQKGANRT